MNRADSSGGIEPDDLAAGAGRVPEHQVVSDGRLVVRSNNEGVPFVLADPNAQVSKDIASPGERPDRARRASRPRAGRR